MRNHLDRVHLRHAPAFGMCPSLGSPTLCSALLKHKGDPRGPPCGMTLAPQIPMGSEFLGCEELLAKSLWPPPEGQRDQRTLSFEFFLSLFQLGPQPNSCLLPRTSLPLPHWHLGPPICCTPAAPQHPLLFCPFRPSPDLAFQELQPHSLALILSSPPAPPYIAGQELGPRDLAHPPVSQSVGRETLQALRPRVLILYSHCTPPCLLPACSHLYQVPSFAVCLSLQEKLIQSHLLPTSIFQLRESIPRERPSRNWPGPPSLHIDAQEPSW